jgi:hypothetical protein
MENLTWEFREAAGEGRDRVGSQQGGLLHELSQFEIRTMRFASPTAPNRWRQRAGNPEEERPYQEYEGA